MKRSTFLILAAIAYAGFGLGLLLVPGPLAMTVTNLSATRLSTYRAVAMCISDRSHSF